MITSRKIEDLHPIVQKMAKEFIAKCNDAGIDVLITSTYRDNEAQDALYAIGRTKAGKKLTNARAGMSFHNHKVALDFCPIFNSKCLWMDKEKFIKCGEIAEKLGFEWAGRWLKFREMAHIQYTQGLSIQDFKEGKQLK